MTDNPLGLPYGSVRAIISLVIVIGGVIGLFVAPEVVQNKLRDLIMIVIGFYFGSKIPTKKETT